MSTPGFTIEVSQNHYLPAGQREVNAIVTVTYVAAVDDRPESAAEIIILDCSGSMSAVSKIGRAREAGAVAIGAIRDGVAFAVIRGRMRAQAVYPKDGTMAIADARTREAALRAVGKLRAGGGTRIGNWLLAARATFLTREDRLRHAILLTDGRNGQLPSKLDAAIRQCEDIFRCDCRGVGIDWNVSELRKISTALLGTVDIVPDPAGLAADFEAMMQSSMAKKLGDVTLRVWVPRGATVRFLKQVAPAVEDLSGRRAEAGPQAGDYPAGAWGNETRDYHLCVSVEPGPVGQEKLAARVSVIQDSQVLAQGLVRAIWSGEEKLSAGINHHVAHYTGQAELAQAIRDGLDALKASDTETATTRLGRAVALAHESGNEDTAGLLARVVDVIDPATGTVRLKATVADTDEMALDTRSTKTVRVKK